MTCLECRRGLHILAEIPDDEVSKLFYILEARLRGKL